MKIARGGDQLLTAPTRRINSRNTLLPENLENLIVCSAVADVDNEIACRLATPLSGASLLDEAEQALLAVTKAASDDEGAIRTSTLEVDLDDGVEVLCHEISPIECKGKPLPIGGESVPIVDTCDILVVGAGTSGMPAAMSAAQAGADTIVTDKYGDIGGTHTIGGVSKFWFGRHTDYVIGFNREAKALVRNAGAPKCLVLLHLLRNSGARIIFHARSVGTLVKNGAVVGAVYASEYGLVGIRGKRVIDATSDGDLVARAGIETDFGTRRDASTLWYSYAQYIGTNPEAVRHFAFAVDPRDPADMTQAIITGRRYNVRPGCDAPQVYLTPRETRHIRAACRISVMDILAGTRWRDLLFVCKANFDIKGIEDSNLSFLGFIEWARLRNYTVQIPYRALLPLGLDNLIVVGKAYSVTHDALSLARMQPDMMAMGAAAARAAVRSLNTDVPLPDIDIQALQQDLLEAGLLKDEDLESINGIVDHALPPLSDDEIQARIEQWFDGELLLDGQGELLARPEKALPLLKTAHDKASGAQKEDFARALAYLHDDHGADTLLSSIEAALADDDLPYITKLENLRHGLPDHGFAPEMVFWMHCLARLGDKRVIPHMVDVANRWYEDETEDADRMYCYAFSICHAAEDLRDPACAKELRILAEKPGLHKVSVSREGDPRTVANGRATSKGNRYAYLELCVGRALVGCGDNAGYPIILRYLQDIRGFLARSAHDELVELLSVDLGYDPAAWQSVIPTSFAAKLHRPSSSKRIKSL